MKRRALRFCLPATMVAGAAALVLTPTLQAAPAAQADEVAHAAGFAANLKWSTTLNDASNPIALSSPNVANLDGQPSVVVGDRAGLGLRLPPQRRLGRRRLALQRRRARRLLAVGRPDQRQRARHGLRRQRRHHRAGVRRLPGHHPQRRRPVVRPGDQPRHRPHAPFGRRRLADRRLLRRRLRRRGGLARAEHRTRWAPATAPCWAASRGSRATRCSRRRRWPTSTPTATTRSSAVATPAPAWPTARPTPTAATSASSRARATRDQPAPNGGLICQYNTNQNIDRSSPAVGQFLAGGGRRHRHRRRELLLGSIGLQQGLRHQHQLRSGLERSAQRGDRRLARPGRRDGQRAARRRRGDPGGNRSTSSTAPTAPPSGRPRPPAR